LDLGEREEVAGEDCIIGTIQALILLRLYEGRLHGEDTREGN